MKSLVPYDKDVMGEYDKIAAQKHKERREILQRIRSTIEGRFDAYEKAKTTLEKIDPLEQPFTKEEEEALLHCYKEPPAAMTNLLGMIQAQQTLTDCQYCCGMTLADTWDHYLQKTPHPEFACFAPNLVRACFTCNTNRPFWIAQGRRTCIHFYYDTFDASVPLIEATIAFDSRGKPAATFQLSYDPAESTDDFKLLFAKHFDSLKLEDRLRIRAPALLEDIGMEVADSREWLKEEDDLIRHLARRNETLSQKQGANHIKPTLYRAASKSPELIRYYLQSPRGSSSGATS